jgi:hypothetical protein
MAALDAQRAFEDYLLSVPQMLSACLTYYCLEKGKIVRKDSKGDSSINTANLHTGASA